MCTKKCVLCLKARGSCNQLKDMFTLYPASFCSVSKVAPTQCKKKLMFCCGAEIVPKRSHCEQKPIRHTICNASFSFEKIIYQNDRGSVAISAPIKCSDFIQTVSKTNPIGNVPLSTAEQYCSGAENASKAAFLV